MEINYGDFERVIIVSETVRIEEVKASYKDGFLIIHAREQERKKPVEVLVELKGDRDAAGAERKRP